MQLEDLLPCYIGQSPVGGTNTLTICLAYHFRLHVVSRIRSGSFSDTFVNTMVPTSPRYCMVRVESTLFAAWIGFV
jgi:hypothetical protein